tara:strand:+ start:1286 stop:3886 length:2601 start_codon:yes stop_codon:yes gene_type:complete
MGEIFIDGLPFSITIEGDAPTKNEAQRILKLVERLDEVKVTGEKDLRALEDKGLNIPFLDEAMSAEEKQNALNLLDDLNFINKEELSPVEQLGIDRTTSGIIGSMALSAGGFKEMMNLKDEENLKKLYKGVKLFDPKKLAIAGGKTYFGGVFGDVAGRAVFDIANFILTGDPDMLKFLNSIDADTKEAMFYEALGLGLPQIIGAGFRKLTDLKDPVVQEAYRAAERLGIQLNFGQIAKYTGMQRALSPLPYIGGTVRKTLATQAGKINEKFQKLIELYAPISTYSKAGKDIFAFVDKRFATNKKIMARLWDKAYKSHAMLQDKNVFKADSLNKFFTNLTNGNVLRQFKNLPTNDEGIIESYETLVKSGFFENSGLSRAEGAGLKDLIETMRRYQINIKNNGGKVSYETIRNFNDDISGLFKDLTEGDKAFKDGFSKLLAQFRGANDDILLNINETLIKDGIPEELLEGILKDHNNANVFTAAFKKLYESPTGNIFGRYEKNLFQPGFIQEKKSRDQLMKSLLSIKSPEMLKDLQKLIGPNQMKIYINEYLSGAFARSVSDKSKDLLGRTKQLNFEPNKLAKELGFDIRGKDEFVDELFKIAGVNKQQIKDLITSGAFLEGIQIGNPSSFLQRRFQLTGMNNILGSIFAAGGAYKGGEMVFDEDDGIFTKGLKGLVGLWAMRYGIGKVFANPKLASKIADVYNPKQTLKFSTKVDVIRELFNIHHNEDPSAISETVKMFEGVYDDMKDTLNEKELDEVLDLLNDLKVKENIFDKGEMLEEDLQKGEDVRNEIIEEEEVSNINVPVPNNNFDMASIVSGIPDPIPTGKADLDPSLVAKLESVGLPLFAAKNGGIASLMGNKKPQPMVA